MTIKMDDKKISFPAQLLIALIALAIPDIGFARPIMNRHHQLNKDLKSCERQVKKLSGLGYPEKAEKELKKCSKIESQIAKIEAGQEKVDRKLASLEKKKKAKKHLKKKGKKKKKSSHSES